MSGHLNKAPENCQYAKILRGTTRRKLTLHAETPHIAARCLARSKVMTILEGRLVQGLGRAAGFTQIDWVRQQLRELAGIDPHPGTVNLKLDDEHSRKVWESWRKLPGRAMPAADASFCNARCYPVSIAGRIPAAVIVPDLPDYPPDKLEFVAALPLREHLALAEGARVSVELCRPLPLRALLFDLDGTLVDSAAAYLEVARAAARPHGLEITEQHVRHSLASGSNFWRDVVPADRPDRDALLKSMSGHAMREWPRILQEHGKVFAGLAEALDALKQLGIVLGIVSGAHPAVLDLLRENAILERFDAIVLGVDVAKPKPDPEGILKCLDQLGIAPEAAAYVGDTPVDIRASRAAGVRAVGVLTGAGSSASMSAAEPDRLIYSFADLPLSIAAVGGV